MTNSSIRPAQVNPTFAQTGPQAVSAARSPKGRFASPEAPWSVQEVFIHGGWVMGYRVGPNGRIYAKRADAVRFAAHRAAKLSQASVHAN
jgi:hypothetical protein